MERVLFSRVRTLAALFFVGMVMSRIVESAAIWVADVVGDVNIVLCQSVILSMADRTVPER